MVAREPEPAGDRRPAILDTKERRNEDRNRELVRKRGQLSLGPQALERGCREE